MAIFTGDLLPAEDPEQVLEAITACDYTCTHECKGHNMQHSGHMVEIYSKRLVRGIGKVLLTKFIKNRNEIP